MHTTVLLFEGFTALDVIGGYEVLARIPEMKIEMTASRSADFVEADTRMLRFATARSIGDITHTDVLYVPGGPGVEAASRDEQLLAAVRRLHELSTWTIGICNGVGLLAAAGILRGKKVTTNWSYRESLVARGIDVVTARYHRDGKVVTGAGVSASIDAGLFLASLLAGRELAQLIRLGIEYYPSPPFEGTSADDAPAAAKDLVRHFNRASAESWSASGRP